MPTRSLARAVAPLLAVLMTGCDGAMESETLEARSRASQQAAGLRLPTSAKVVFAHRVRGLDDAAQIIALMPTADWQALEHRIEATVPGTQPPSIENAAYLGTDHDGWTPGRAWCGSSSSGSRPEPHHGGTHQQDQRKGKRRQPARDFQREDEPVSPRDELD